MLALLGALDRLERDESVAAALVTDAVVVRTETDLRWLDMCESRVTALTGTSTRKGSSE